MWCRLMLCCAVLCKLGAMHEIIVGTLAPSAACALDQVDLMQVQTGVNLCASAMYQHGPRAFIPCPFTHAYLTLSAREVQRQVPVWPRVAAPPPGRGHARLSRSLRDARPPGRLRVHCPRAAHVVPRRTCHHGGARRSVREGAGECLPPEPQLGADTESCHRRRLHRAERAARLCAAALIAGSRAHTLCRACVCARSLCTQVSHRGARATLRRQCCLGHGCSCSATSRRHAVVHLRQTRPSSAGMAVSSSGPAYTSTWANADCTQHCTRRGVEMSARR